MFTRPRKLRRSRLPYMIYERLCSIEGSLAAFLSCGELPQDELLDSRKMRLLTNMSDRTLLRRRTEGTLPFVRYGGKIYYIKSQVLHVIGRSDPKCKD